MFHMNWNKTFLQDCITAKCLILIWKHSLNQTGAGRLQQTAFLIFMAGSLIHGRNVKLHRTNKDYPVAIHLHQPAVMFPGI